MTEQNTKAISVYKYFPNDFFKYICLHFSIFISCFLQSANKPCFGFLFDIDGVIVRGKNLLPSAKEAFKLLTDEYGRFIVPALFVTNAGNMLRQEKAKQLSKWLNVQVIIFFH